MTLVKYMIFQKVAECGSFTKASLELNMTQSAVSHAIGSLEKSMDFALFSREKSQIKLTYEGSKILDYVNILLASERKLLRKINDIKELDEGLIRIGSFSGASNRFIPPIIKSVQNEYPNIHIEIKEGSYKEIRNWLDNGEIDIAFMVENYVNDKDFSRLLFKDEILAVLPQKYKTIYKSYFDIKDLEKLPFILPDNLCDKFVENVFRNHNVTPNIVYKIRLNSTVFSMIEEDLGVSFAAESNLHKLNYDFITLPFKERIYRHVYLITNEAEAMSQIVEKFITKAIGFKEITNIK